MDNSKIFCECGPGWESIVLPILKEADALGATVTCVKEKYGEIRIYFNPGQADCDTLEDMIESAEHASRSMCELCGKPGTMRRRSEWYKTLCSEHALDLGYRIIV